MKDHVLKIEDLVEVRVTDFEDLLPDNLDVVTISDFCQLPICREGDSANIVVAYYLGGVDGGKQPVGLPGFSTDSGKSDFIIYEEAFAFFDRLRQETKK